MIIVKPYNKTSTTLKGLKFSNIKQFQGWFIIKQGIVSSMTSIIKFNLQPLIYKPERLMISNPKGYDYSYELVWWGRLGAMSIRTNGNIWTYIQDCSNTRLGYEVIYLYPIDLRMCDKT